MKEIKFRAWDKELKFIQYNIGIAKLKYSPFAVENIGWLVDPSDNKTALMQYTGLKDKNGREIYEGDILFCEAENYKGKVWFNRGGFMTDCEGFGNHFVAETNTEDLEIIGNIYENPDLLK